MRIIPCAATVFSIVMLAGCAKRTFEITPDQTDPKEFFGMTCSELVAERAKTSQALIFSGLAQDQISDDDKMRTLGIPTPMGSLFNEGRENQIARLKGKVRAINANMSALRCGPDYR
jgi:hypothetical protein